MKLAERLSTCILVTRKQAAYGGRAMTVMIAEPAFERIPKPAFSPARLRAARERQGLTQAQLGRCVGRELRSMQRYELGEGVPPTELLCLLAAVLLVPIGDFFE